jgi:hypothetical protein
MVPTRQFRSEIVENVSGIAKSREQYQRRPASAPIKNFDVDIFVDANNTYTMG